LKIFIYTYPDAHGTSSYFINVFSSLGINHHVINYIDKLEALNISEDDIFFFIDPIDNWPIGIEKIKGLKICYLIDTHLDFNLRFHYAQFFDVVFLAQHDHAIKFHNLGVINCYWIPLACEPSLHELFGNDRVKEFEIGFVGKLGGPGTTRRKNLESIMSMFQHNDITTFYPPADMARIYSKSKIVLNFSINNDLNMRIFEAIASGALLVTNKISNGIDLILIDGLDYISYSNSEDAISKIKYYLNHTNELDFIANNGYKKSLANTYLIRWQEILKILNLINTKKIFTNNIVDSYSYIYMRLNQPFMLFKSIRTYGVTCYSLYNFGLSLIKLFLSKLPLLK
jgi:hypothetical protein